MSNWLLALYVVGIFTSISVMDGGSFLLGLWLLGTWGKAKSFTGRKIGFEKNFLLWVGVVILGFFLNGVAGNVWLAGLGDLKWMILLYTLVWFFDLYELQANHIKFLAIVGILVSLYAVSITVLGFDILRPQRTDLLWISTKGGVRTPGFLGNAMTFAQSTGVWFMALVGFALAAMRVEEFKYKKLVWIAAGLLGLAVFCSFTRGVWLSVGVSLLLVVGLVRWKWAVGLFLAGVLSLGLMVGVSETLRERLSESFVSKSGLNSEREVLWKVNWQMFLDHPILGVGYGENSAHLPEYYEKMGVPEDFFKSHAHNQILEQLAGTGILGLLAYLLFFGGLFWQTLKAWRFLPEDFWFERAIALAALGAVSHMFLGGLFEANFEDSETLHSFLIVVAVFLATRRKVVAL